MVKITHPIGGTFELAKVTAVILNITTAYQLIHRTALRLTDGDTVLVHSAAGGLGSSLVELLRLEFPKLVIIGTCSADKRAFVESLGCDEVVDYKSERFELAVHRITKGKGVRAVFDGVGGENFARSFTCLSTKGGMLVMYGNTGNSKGFVRSIATNLGRNLNPFSRKSSTFYGIILVREKAPEKLKEDMTAVFELLQKGRINPHIDAVVELKNVGNALKYMESGKSKGHVVAIIDAVFVEQYRSQFREFA
jgi:NADPH:quinone reductase-like Zn-dependent oxidoreductase